MKTVLVLSSSPAFPETISAGLGSSVFKVVHRIDFRQAEPLLRAGMIELAIVDIEGDAIQTTWTLEQLRRISPRSPIIACVSTQNHGEAEEDAYLQGASHVLTKPVRVRALSALVERLLLQSPHSIQESTGPSRTPSSRTMSTDKPAMPRRSASALEALDLVRDSSVV